MKTGSYIYILLFLLISTVSSIAQNTSIKEEKFITIGGIEQWITINGNDNTKPVILFIHGGPGSTMSQYDDAIFYKWDDDFILVNWDQRGAGKTYGRNTPTELNKDYLTENPLTVEQMTEDGVEVAKYLINYLKKDKIILLGTSWGSILGSKIVLNSPELFHAYIGHAQFVNFSKNMNDAFQTVTEIATKQENTDDINKLKSLGKPPYNNAKNYGQLLRIVKKHERESSTPAPNTWFKLKPNYDNDKDSKDRYDGDDYSFVNFVGHEKLQIKSMAANINFNQDGLVFKIPVYLIQGEHDILCSKEINKAYFDKIEAPEKAYFLIPDAAHGFNKSIIDKQYSVIKNILSN